MMSFRRKIVFATLVIFISSSMAIYGNPEKRTVQSLILDLTESDFLKVANNCGWNNNHVAISEQGVTSINYIAEISVYSNDNKFLFYIPKSAMTRSLIEGYLQLAVYNRAEKTTTMLEKIPILKTHKEILPDDIVIEVTLDQFRMEVKKVDWEDYLIPRNQKQVNPVNWYKYISVYTSDGVLLFDISRDQAEFALSTGYIKLAIMPNSTTIKIVSEIKIRK